tara:strand:+ start:719 stop:1015 length:297 start_codon:yes stop_codon:yes gene_type:complete
MENYKLTDNTQIIRILDSAFIPADPANSDYAAYLEWVEEGNTPEAADVPPDPTYKELRAAEYNLKTTGEQFGMQYDDAKNSTTTWVDWQTEIKVRIPE